MHAQEPKQPLYEMWVILRLGSKQTRKSPAGPGATEPRSTKVNVRLLI
jgi:hypothetical protein